MAFPLDASICDNFYIFLPIIYTNPAPKTGTLSTAELNVVIIITIVKYTTNAEIRKKVKEFTRYFLKSYKQEGYADLAGTNKRSIGSTGVAD